MNLIANSGIQFFNFPMEIDMNDNFKMYFHEWFDIDDEKLKLEIAHYFAEDEIWVRKRDIYNLLGLGLTNGKVGRIENGRFLPYTWEDVKDDFYDEGYRPLSPMETDDGGSDCFPMSLSRCHLEKFENRWLPFPFFTLGGNGKSEFAPTNWCRCMLVPEGDVINNKKKYNLLLVFDTRTKYEEEGFEEEDLMETPVFSNNYDREKHFAVCNNEFSLVDFCSKTEKCDCEWVDEYLIDLYHSTPEIKITSIDQVRCKKPKMSYLAQYVFLVKYIQESGILPVVTLFTNKNVAFGDVDLVIDMGNSRTCAVLYDNPDENRLKNVELLGLQNFTNPLKAGELNHVGATFDMRLAFREVKFGVETLRDSLQFVFPSMVRLGNEADELIHQAVKLNTGVEKISTFSSPKRYLWDGRLQKKEWEFVTQKGEEEHNRLVYVKGVSEQLNPDGSLNPTGEGGIDKYYSRKALMTFGMLEILAQAFMRINSYEFRQRWGEENKPRRLGRIIVSCPTAMSRIEQITLRKSVENAAIIINRFYDGNYNEEIDEKEARRNIHVIPSVKNLLNKEERLEWIYDEATCSQFVYLFSELTNRYNNNCEEFFDFYGKVRKDLKGYDKKSLTIGSVDIGAGTTDIMIAAYKYYDSGQCTLTPVPMFWESFYVAGDDLLKNMIRDLIIEGDESVIKTHLIKQGSKDAAKTILDFFAPDNARQSIIDRQIRSEFNLQVSVPVVSTFLQLLNENKVDVKYFTYDEMFANNRPTERVLQHFEKHFGFSIKDVQWHYDKKQVSEMVIKTFGNKDERSDNSLVGKISAILAYYGCDIVLLSGRPTSLQPLTDLFLDHLPVLPNRLITLNNYRVGTWYPFQDGKGYFKDAKSIVAVGAMIGNYASTRGSLGSFSLDLGELVKIMTPTTEYFAKNEKDDAFISPEKNKSVLEVSQLPMRIWTRQLNTFSYPTRPFYMLGFNEEKIKEKMVNKYGITENDDKMVTDMLNNEIQRVRALAPFIFSIVRENYSEDKERLVIESVSDRNGDDLPINYFSLSVQSMSEAEDYWLDSGAFMNLGINA